MSKSNEPSSTLNYLSEKFSPATLPEIYAPRHELLKRFNEAAINRFIYVGAQAGSGKTVSTLLWLNACRRKAVWIGLDGYDNSPSVFYKLLATGIYSTQPDNENIKNILTDPSFSATPVEHMISLISEMLPDNGYYALVLDDMHSIDNGEIIKSLPLVLKRLPRSFVVLVLSRKDIFEEYASLVKNADTDIITPVHLQFSEDEIRRYFNSLGRFLTPEESKFAFMATDGWAIGVNAIAKSGQVELGGGSGYIFSRYFQEHIWDTWDEELKHFCLSTCIVNEFDIELATKLSKREDTYEVVEELSKTNTFLSRLHGDTYRYHHLFQDYLKELLISSDVNLTELYKIAAIYYKDHKDYSKALRYWLDSGDYKGIDSYLYLFLFENNRGFIADYADFLKNFFVTDFPEKAFDALPALHILSAWYYYLTSQHKEFEWHMDQVYKNLPRIAMGDSEFVEYAILAYSVDHRTRILTKVKQFKYFQKFVGHFTKEGLATRIPSFSHNMPYLHRSNLDYSDLALKEDSLDKMENTFAILLGLEWEYIRPGISASFDYERNDLHKAFEGINATYDILNDKHDIEGWICILITKHSILHRLDLHKDAESTMNELTDIVNNKAQFFIPNLEAYKTKISLFNSDKTSARKWLDNYYVIETEHIELFRIFQHFTTARAYMVLDERDKAIKYINLLIEYSVNFNRPLDEAEALILKSCLEWTTGLKKEALDTLEQGMIILEPYKFTRIIADEGVSVLPILKRLYIKVSADEYSGKLSREFVNEALLAAHSFSKLCKGVTANINVKDKPIKLSTQQKNMLTLLAKGYKNSEIVELTGLKIPTIKSHTSIAYKKLNVNNAMDAVLKARELGLID